MKRPKPIGAEAKASLYRLLKRSEGTRAYPRVLCVWLRAELGLDSEEIIGKLREAEVLLAQG